MNAYAEKVGCGDLGVEQMYSPHQVPWRIDETRNLIKHVTKESGRSFYFTEDVGHHHHKFLRPTEAQIKQAFKNCHATGEVADIWLGSIQTFQAFSQAAASNNVLTPSALKKILAMIDDTPHMFSELPDSDCYTWLKALGCYSPIIHLQQTNGHQSAHKHFTKQNNSEGIIAPERVLRALKESF